MAVYNRYRGNGSRAERIEEPPSRNGRQQSGYFQSDGHHLTQKKRGGLSVPQYARAGAENAAAERSAASKAALSG